MGDSSPNLSDFLQPPAEDAAATPAAEAAPAVELTADQKEAQELNGKVMECLKDYKGEGNIPISHDYWNWQNRIRALNNKGK